MLNAIVVATTILQIMVGLLVFRKGRRSITHLMFGAISLSTLAWALTNYVYTLDPGSDGALVIMRLTLFFVVCQNVAFYIFANNYPAVKNQLSVKRLRLYLLTSVFVGLATISPYLFVSVTVIDGQANPNPGFFMPLFLAHAIYSITVGLRALARKRRVATGRANKQLQIIQFASVLIWVVVPITNLALTLALHTTFFARLGPIYTLVFGAIIAYAIVAQRLFDIRSAIARSVAYTMTLGLLVSAYVLAAFIVPAHFFGSSTVNMQTQMVNAVLAILLAFSFQPVKMLFDRLSNRLFYQDAYEPQELLNKINHVLVETVTLDQLLTGTLSHVEDAIKSEFSAALVKGDGMNKMRVFTTRKTAAAGTDKLYVALAEAVGKRRDDIVLADELSQGDEALAKLMRKNNIAVIARIDGGSHLGRHILGFVVLGPKRNGNPYSRLDVRVLEIIANELVIAIQNALHFEEIQNFTLTLQSRIDEATRELRRTNAKLKMLDETKDDFISMASHQLRTPLTSVKGYLSMVLEGDAGELTPLQRKMLDQAFVSSQRMVFLIADLLNISRLKTGKFTIEPTEIDLPEMVADEVNQLLPSATGRSLELVYKKPASFPAMHLDETKTRQIIMNFIDNAIYYTPSGGTIRVELTDKPEVIEFRVTDDGIGVPKQEQPHLFTKFYRAGNARRARPDGTGLGLFMAKKVIAGQGGAIIFESREGKGSTFGFVFPKTKRLTSTNTKE